MPANIRDDFVGNAASPALGGRMSYADLLQSSPYALYRPPAYKPLDERLAGDVIDKSKTFDTMQKLNNALRQLPFATTPQTGGAKILPITPPDKRAQIQSDAQQQPQNWTERPSNVYDQRNTMLRNVRMA